MRSEAESRKGVGEFAGLEFFHVKAKRIINPLPAGANLPFRFTLNAYRGCSHACVYCFARPTHRYLDLGIGADFDSKIVVKVNAVERLRAELNSKSWQGDAIAMGTNTDPYQRCEGKYRLTQGIVQVLSDARNPFSILTKSTLILRDIELLAEAANRTRVATSFSIGTLNEDVWRMTEPGTPKPQQRVAAIRRLSTAGIDCGVLIAPIIPGLSDGERDVAAVVEACVDAGAKWITPLMLHLKPGVKEHWFEWMQTNYPELLPRHQRLYGRRVRLLPATQAAMSSFVKGCEATARVRGNSHDETSAIGIHHGKRASNH